MDSRVRSYLKMEVDRISRERVARSSRADRAVMLLIKRGIWLKEQEREKELRRLGDESLLESAA